MKRYPQIKALVFDAYGTVFDVHSVAVRAEKMFPGKGQALSQGWRAKQLEYMFLRTLMNRYVPHNRNTEAALTYVARQLQLPCGPAERSELMNEYLHLKPFADVPPALVALRNYRRAILSVGTPDMLSETVRNAGLQDQFEKLISVDSVKVYKPHPRVYQLAAEELGVTKEEVGFVTSNYFDVAGAKAYGFTVFWINRTGAFPDELDLNPDVVLGSLTELVSTLA
jgi:2-haloacid dehalogenase